MTYLISDEADERRADSISNRPSCKYQAHYIRLDAKLKQNSLVTGSYLLSVSTTVDIVNRMCIQRFNLTAYEEHDGKADEALIQGIL